MKTSERDDSGSSDVLTVQDIPAWNSLGQPRVHEPQQHTAHTRERPASRDGPHPSQRQRLCRTGEGGKNRPVQ